MLCDQKHYIGLPQNSMYVGELPSLELPIIAICMMKKSAKGKKSAKRFSKYDNDLTSTSYKNIKKTLKSENVNIYIKSHKTYPVLN